ncbi:nuclease [Acinetobacter sp. Ac_877]|uniref:thermonuclease family protein n=1 Tax=Acinetobacter portensis TaxID=1839785 RepID=UPI00128D4959|nr:thermonuclease family protein [Acinetobacter portensis]MPW40306.1 nuclease [Acinetobacter portensis]
MLSNLSAGWLLTIGVIVGILCIFIFRKIYNFTVDFFKPFKKGKTYWCRVTAVSDGDTLTCYRLNLRRSKTKIRFAYIDAPESNQEYGDESQKLVKKLVYRRLIRVNITDVDRYGRCVAVVYRRTRNVNEELVKRGAAWVYEEYIKNANKRQHWMALQNQAQKQKKGLWKSSKPVRPSVYRKQHK